MQLVRDVYVGTRLLPKEETYGLTMQMRRAAVSIPSNVAEGWNSSSPANYVRHLHIARGSAQELVTQAEICSMLKYDGSFAAIVEQAEEVVRILNGLIRSLRQHVTGTKDR